MNVIAGRIAFFFLAATIAPAFWFLLSSGSDTQLQYVKHIMLIATLGWFASAGVWMYGKQKPPTAPADHSQ
ncbi:MAG: hypothetical protein AAGH92_12175 [Planctomycetota bacterium]